MQLILMQDVDARWRIACEFTAYCDNEVLRSVHSWIVNDDVTGRDSRQCSKWLSDTTLQVAAMWTQSLLVPDLMRVPSDHSIDVAVRNIYGITTTTELSIVDFGKAWDCVCGLKRALDKYAKAIKALNRYVLK
jgi:hypothetical protein